MLSWYQTSETRGLNIQKARQPHKSIPLPKALDLGGGTKKSANPTACYSGRKIRLRRGENGRHYLFLSLLPEAGKHMRTKLLTIRANGVADFRRKLTEATIEETGRRMSATTAMMRQDRLNYMDAQCSSDELEEKIAWEAQKDNAGL